MQGIFSLDPSNPVTAGDVIEPGWANPTLADIAQGLTDTLVRDGRAPMTGALVLYGDAAASLVAVPKRQLDAAIAAITLAAYAVVNTPSGGIGAVTVQAAINELDSEKQPQNNQLTTLASITTQQAADIASLSAFIGTLLNDPDAATARVTLGISVFPVGTIIDFAGITAPTGFLACPLVATNISRVTYANLFAAIGVTWGAGDGSTTFGMPWFPADYAGVQANANVGTTTVGAVISHSHVLANGQNPATIVGGGFAYSSLGSQDGATNPIAPTGGAANLAAGNRILKCVKI